jgi:uncharacterized protein (DUF302 family)
MTGAFIIFRRNTEMSSKNRIIAGISFAIMLMIGGLQPAFAAGNDGFVSVQSSSSYTDTVSKLRKMVAKNGMMVLGEINQGKVMTMTGMNLKAVSLFVGNPNVGKKLFTEDSGVGIVLPVRINVYERNGATYVNYFEPSEQLKAFHDKKLVMMGQMLDQKLAKMTGMLK